MTVTLSLDTEPGRNEFVIVLQRGALNERKKVVLEGHDPRVGALLDLIIELETDPEAKPYPEAYKEMTCSRMATSTASRPAPPRRRPRLLDRGLDRIWKMWAGQ